MASLSLQSLSLHNETPGRGVHLSLVSNCRTHHSYYATSEKISFIRVSQSAALLQIHVCCARLHSVSAALRQTVLPGLPPSDRAAGSPAIRPCCRVSRHQTVLPGLPPSDRVAGFSRHQTVLPGSPAIRPCCRVLPPSDRVAGSPAIRPCCRVSRHQTVLPGSPAIRPRCRVSRHQTVLPGLPPSDRVGGQNGRPCSDREFSGLCHSAQSNPPSLLPAPVCSVEARPHSALLQL